jgi:transcriptional regulator with XRE-family HTH domain/Zn-dependent peptidase ImmA (M78 family)
MDDERVAVGRRVARLRERRGLTQQQLGERASLERSAIAKIEIGRRGVGALEVMRLALALELDVEMLLADSPESVLEHRTRLDPGLDLAPIDELLEKFSRNVQFVASLDPKLVNHTLHKEALPSEASAIEALAEKVRRLCGVPSGRPARDLPTVVAKVGMMTLSRPLGVQTADAASTPLQNGAVCVVNSTSSVGRRRIALAHELGHYLVRDHYVVDWRVSDSTSTDSKEIFLDRFARAFLAPQRAFQGFWKDASSKNPLRTTAVLAGSYFQIDMATIARRLDELNMASDAELQSVRAVRTLKADILEHGLYAPIDLEDVSVTTSYARAVLRLYEKEKVSKERALGLLMGTFDDDDLPTLPDRHVDEIWSLF